ncbi:MAG: DUF1186 domain-containing protein [Planctomycetota bacterium]|nr:MAG: DUF1186 domain-containing protein [Planctomycetota bacterium]
MSVDSIAEPTTDLDEIIAELDSADSRFPEQALRAAQRNRDRIIPRLIQCLVDAADQAERDEPPRGDAHFFAFFLVGEFRAREALPAILRMVSLPREVLHKLLGDAVTECLASVLAALTDDPDVLDRLIDDEEIDHSVRWAAAATYLLFVRDGRLTREQAVGALQRHLRKAIERNDAEAAGFLVSELIDYADAETLPEMREAFDSDLVDPFLIDRDYVEEKIQKGEAEFQRKIKACQPTGIDDTVEELRDWHSFAEPEQHEEIAEDRETADQFRAILQQLARGNELDVNVDAAADDEDSPKPAATIHRERKRVSRNEPCPCGSGKKYKRCCGASG